MSFYTTIGLLVLNVERTKFLVCRKAPYSLTQQWILPGGTIDLHSELESLRSEIKEELDSDVVLESIHYINSYSGRACGTRDKDITIKLYRGELFAPPRPNAEVAAIGWIGKEDSENPEVCDVVRERIIPDLVERGILR